jgi:hypothetical protein
VEDIVEQANKIGTGSTKAMAKNNERSGSFSDWSDQSSIQASELRLPKRPRLRIKFHFRLTSIRETLTN